ncbi:hypothetical protein D3574_24010 [Salmonella enterica]|nr:hypothetical protein [Salmonella enterica]EBV3482244.1 hypothetical protein [Salmonella enterica subsp. enterica serovar Saintpaul]
MNAIYTNQSTRENLDLLYAQARVYDRVKNWNRLNFLFSIIYVCRSTSDKQFWLPECQRKHIVTFTSGRLASSFHRNRLSVKKEE